MTDIDNNYCRLIGQGRSLWVRVSREEEVRLKPGLENQVGKGQWEKEEGLLVW